MLTKHEKLIAYLDRLPIAYVRTAWINRVRAEHEREDRVESDLVESGMERVECDGPLMPDGREVMRLRGRAYALRPEVHAERLAQRFEAARQRQAEQRPEQPEIKEAIASTTCPQMVDGKPCGGALNRRGVCPSCVTGRMGYRYRYTCESCGCDIVTKEELR